MDINVEINFQDNKSLPRFRYLIDVDSLHAINGLVVNSCTLICW